MAAFLPPGVVFIPNDEILIGYYLANKNNEELHIFNGSHMIKEMNLYDTDPFELRHCTTGFWKKKGNVRNITNADNVVLGTKTLFVFYLGKSPNDSERTNWTMYEYALANNPQARFVLCRVFDCPIEMEVDDEFGPISDVDETDCDESDNELEKFHL
ncbi:NAC domain-containing protein 96-like [Vicia villosa]|uniref:NAC domain-containing protein 96-like n=1 Tax=Vicia villosa TaxID=3911 RepID=UPI00273AE753|nr:NAC domain-containing protein 96-like [Vicia villosa]XP_058767500.1 NAC domain-containing protein 96-like [Vicia villosa]